MTLSAPKSVSLMAMMGGDERIVEAHDRAVAATLGWIEKNAIETRMRDPATGAMVRAGQGAEKTVMRPAGWRRRNCTGAASTKARRKPSKRP